MQRKMYKKVCILSFKNIILLRIIVSLHNNYAIKGNNVNTNRVKQQQD